MCADQCNTFDHLIFRLKARVVAGFGEDTWIDCQGETVSYFKQNLCRQEMMLVLYGLKNVVKFMHFSLLLCTSDAFYLPRATD